MSIVEGPVMVQEAKVASTADSVPMEINLVVPAGETALYCESGTYKAAAIRQGANFVVLKGSKINATTTPTCPASAINTRTKFADVISEDFVLSEDITFASPSGAACFVAGASRNGYTEWHTSAGVLLKDLGK